MDNVIDLLEFKNRKNKKLQNQVETTEPKEELPEQPIDPGVVGRFILTEDEQRAIILGIKKGSLLVLYTDTMELDKIRFSEVKKFGPPVKSVEI